MGHNEQGLLAVIEFEKQKHMTKEQIIVEADKYNRSLSKHPMSVHELTEVLVGFYERLKLLQQTPCSTPLALLEQELSRVYDAMIQEENVAAYEKLYDRENDLRSAIKLIKELQPMP